MSYNSKAFIPEEVGKGYHLDLINYLLDYNTKSEKYYYDIHITTDSYCTIVEWCERDYKNELGNERFEFVDDDQYIMTEVRLPDGQYKMVYPDEVQETWDQWIKENPTWEKNEFGMWRDTDCDMNISEEKQVQLSFLDKEDYCD